MNVMVTGGAGFVGSHLVRRIVSQGTASITVLDNLHRGCFENLSDCLADIGFLRGDVRDSLAMNQALRGIDLVYHLAAQSSVIGATTDLDYTVNTNVTGTFNILQAAKMNGVKRVVFTSSREVYGDSLQLPVPETAPLRPRNSYGASKAAGEACCRVLACDGLETAVLRLANVYGPGDKDRVLPIFIENALEGRPLLLYGGEQIVDFVWIDVVVEALSRVGFGEPIAEPLNVGSGRGTTISALAQRVLEVTGSRSTVDIAPSREPEVKRFVADVRRAKQLIGLEQPKDPLSRLHEVIASARERIVASHVVGTVTRTGNTDLYLA